MGILRSAHSEARINLGARVLVGRSPTCALRVPERVVSAEHAVLWWAEDQWWVRDLGSRNGTFLDGRRLPTGEAQPLQAGSRLSFGQREEEWVLEDALSPSIIARRLSARETLVARDGLLLLPDEATPELTIFRNAYDRWIAESETGLIELEDEAILEAGGSRWQLYLPRGTSASLPATQEALEPLSLRFAVSADEEYVEVRLRYAGGEHVLEPRVYHYMLLTLARARLADQQARVPDEGWVYAEDLMRMLRIDRTTMNLLVFRCRKQLATQGIQALGELIERRPNTRQMRIGTPLVTVTTL